MSGLCTSEEREIDESLDGLPPLDHELVVLQYCPQCGYDLHAAPLNGPDEMICCAECGSEWRHEQLLASPPAGPIGQVALAIAAWAVRSLKVGIFIALLTLLIGFLLAPALTKTRCCCRLPRTTAQLRQISTSMMWYAADHNDRYPQHAAQLLIGDYAGTDSFTNPRKLRAVSFVGAFQLESYDGSARSQSALRNAVNMTDLDAPCYRVGDFWIMRFDRPMLDGRLISGWSYVDSTGKRSVMFEDGHTFFATASDWPQLWQTDAAARQSLNLPAVTAPAW